MKPDFRLRLGRVRAWRALFAVGLSAGIGCGGLTKATPPAPTPPPQEQERAGLVLDPEASPIEFRRLSDDAVLVAPGTGARALASFGNFVARSARRLPSARLAVWDDEEAWRRSLEGEDSESFSAHKRAQYVKEAEPEPIEEYQVFGAEGGILYERDFRDWPLTDTD
jgi:hypothetical protein